LLAATSKQPPQDPGRLIASPVCFGMKCLEDLQFGESLPFAAGQTVGVRLGLTVQRALLDQSNERRKVHLHDLPVTPPQAHQTLGRRRIRLQRTVYWFRFLLPWMMSGIPNNSRKPIITPP